MGNTNITFWQDLDRLRSLLAKGQFDRATDLLHSLAATGGSTPGLSRSRAALLEEIAGIYGLDLPAATTASSTSRVLVSGIGRSGTTLIYQQLAKLLLLETESVNFRYEPYLWNVREPVAVGNAFGTEELHHFGLHTHLATPLFLSGAHETHDRFLDQLFDTQWDRDADRKPDAYLTKVIRGSGRLRAYLARFPDLKIVICLRNPMDTINSSLGMFSFYGEEFHPNDRARFQAALEQQNRLAQPLPDSPNAIEWYGAWWRAFTEDSLAVASEHPDNVFLFCHERFQQDNAGVLNDLQDFVGFHNPGIMMGLSRPAGPSIRSISLTAHDIDRLRPHTAYYRSEVLDRFLDPEAAAAYDARLPRKYVAGKFTFPLAGTDLGRKSPIQLRGMMLNGHSSPFQRLVTGPRSPVQLFSLIEAHAPDGQSEEIRTPEPDPASLCCGKTFGAVLTCHNNSGTIVDSILSCLNQTLPFDEIIVVDDGSGDDSLQKLELLAEKYSSLKIVPLENSLGPAAARDIGIRRLSTDFFTQLDGDDQFWPTKNAQEARAIAGDETVVAFSDILLVLPGKTLVQNTSAYAAPTGTELFNRLLARTPQIPRDMTLSRQRYFQAGGYNLVTRLYEDWDFKLRLAACDGGEWRRADGVAGTLYNRLTPGLSGDDPGQHAKALLLIFLRSLAQGTPSPASVLNSFDAALRPFSDRHITRVARSWLAEEIAHRSFDPAEIAAIMSERHIQSADNPRLIDLFERRAQACAEQNAKENA